jgi:hypothetical protein
MSRMSRRLARILRAGSNDGRHASINQCLNSDLSLFVRQERPIPHRSTINHRSHPGLDQTSAGLSERFVIGNALC